MWTTAPCCRRSLGDNPETSCVRGSPSRVTNLRRRRGWSADRGDAATRVTPCPPPAAGSRCGAPLGPDWLLWEVVTSNDPVPRSGEDTFDLVDDAVAALAERRGVWLGDDIAVMALVASVVEQSERWLPQLVHDARANGHGWPEIARALGTSPDEARLRFDPESPETSRLDASTVSCGFPKSCQ